MPPELIGFWYREDVAGGGVKATRSYTFYTSAEYYHEQSLCTGNSCQVQGQEAGSVVVEPGVLTLYPTGGGSRQTRYSVQREHATNDIQLWLHDAFGPGAADMYYLRG